MTEGCDALVAEAAGLKLPTHVAMIMDGNGRWALEQGLSRIEGHRQGVQAVKASIELCNDLHIPYLTLFAFGKDNAKRPADEVSFIMHLFAQQLLAHADYLLEKDVRVHIIGDRTYLKPELVDTIEQVEKKTCSGQGLQITFALNYSGRWDLTQAAQRLAQAVSSGQQVLETVDETVMASYLANAGMPDVDLLIRTGGEYRLSDFLLWQNAYAELVFLQTAWPDFNKKTFIEALQWFDNRERRFGQISAQLDATQVK